MSYIDDRPRTAFVFSDVGLRASLAAFEQPLHTNGSAIYNGESVKISLMVNSPQNLRDGDAMQITLGLIGRLASFDFAGMVQNRHLFTAAGSVTVTTPSLDELFAYRDEQWGGHRVAR